MSKQLVPDPDEVLDSDDHSEAYRQIGQQIMQEAIDRATGKDTDYCAFEQPQREYFVSNLSPGGVETESEEGAFSESKPSMIGLRAKLDEGHDQLRFDASFDLYLRCLPEFEEYRELVEQGQQNEESREFEIDSHQFYTKFSVEVSETLDLTNPLENVAADLTETVNEEVRERKQEAFENRTVYPENGINDVEDFAGINIGNTSDLDEREFEAVRKAAEDSPRLEHRWNLEVELERNGDEITVRLINNSRDSQRKVDSYVFDPVIAVEGNIDNYELAIIPEDFRYDRKIWGKGLNCSTEKEELGDGRIRVESESVPSHQTFRFEHEQEYNTDLGRLQEDDFVDALRNTEDGMRQYLAKWRGEKRRQKAEELSSEELVEYDKAADKFEKEIENFAWGNEVLDKCEEAARAFQLTNRAFDEQPNGIPSWRLFQLVFIVSNIPSIVSREFPRYESDRDDEAEVLWFPTGGGKTEAYLGLIVFGLFFDRIRDKNRGVTAWIRFPLTLLGQQQLSRFLGILSYADKVRSDENLGGEEFSIGYFLGSGNTPNRIGDRNNFDETFARSKSTLENQCKVVEACPRCGGDVDIRYEQEKNAVFHFCINDACEVDDLPLYVTDHEVYRNVPSVLLGTLDKITVIGSNPRFANLFGNLTDKCPVHGYGYSGKCSEYRTVDCNEDLEPAEAEFKDPIPTLHLIDEVHLLGEELGVFAGHYETLYLEVCKLLQNETPKVITSTATISEKKGKSEKPAYARHMEDLFMLEANRFPEEGPNQEESFYGTVTEDPERRYFGITPNNKTHIYAVLDLAKKFHEAVRDYHDKDPSEFDLTDTEMKAVLQMYEISVVYFLKKTEKDRFMRSMNNQIQREMAQDGYDPDESVNIDQLTADVDQPELLEQLENPTEEFVDRIDSIAATSYIGHGIDPDRFNNMFFFGFPPQTFQYIQASSRVGRKVPGFVVDIFKPFKKRDRHRYKYFEKTHEYLTRTVEEISVDRWSKFSLDKTFPGVFKGFLLQYFRPKLYRQYGMNVQSSRDLMNLIDPDDDGDTYPEFTTESFEHRIKRAYGVADGQDNQPYFETQIESKVEGFWNYWMERGKRRPWTTFKENEMQSLRDIGEEGTFTIDDGENDWYAFITQGKS